MADSLNISPASSVGAQLPVEAECKEKITLIFFIDNDNCLAAFYPDSLYVDEKHGKVVAKDLKMSPLILGL
jgi:hypothetical protein